MTKEDLLIVKEVARLALNDDATFMKFADAMDISDKELQRILDKLERELNQ